MGTWKISVSRKEPGVQHDKAAKEVCQVTFWKRLDANPSTKWKADAST